MHACVVLGCKGGALQVSNVPLMFAAALHLAAFLVMLDVVTAIHVGWNTMLGHDCWGNTVGALLVL